MTEYAGQQQQQQQFVRIPIRIVVSTQCAGVVHGLGRGLGGHCGCARWTLGTWRGCAV